MLFQRNQQSFRVFFQFVSVKVHFSDGGVDDAVFVVTVTNGLLSRFNRFSNVRSYGTYFRVRHQATRTQNLPSWPTTRIASGKQ